MRQEYYYNWQMGAPPSTPFRIRGRRPPPSMPPQKQNTKCMSCFALPFKNINKVSSRQTKANKSSSHGAGRREVLVE